MKLPCRSRLVGLYHHNGAATAEQDPLVERGRKRQHCRGHNDAIKVLTTTKASKQGLYLFSVWHSTPINQEVEDESLLHLQK